MLRMYIQECKNPEIFISLSRENRHCTTTGGIRLQQVYNNSKLVSWRYNASEEKLCLCSSGVILSGFAAAVSECVAVPNHRSVERVGYDS